MEIGVMFVIVLYAASSAAEVDTRTRTNKRGKGSMWWGIAKAGEPNNLSPVSPGVSYMDASVHGTLRGRQRRLARENAGVLEAIRKGANLAIQECQYQFRNRWWNCSTRNFLRGKNLFGKIVDRGCRETAFIYAITSAAVAHAIARACSEGAIETCNCDYSHHRSRPQVTGNSAVAGVREMDWGGCSDNIAFGFKFSREFVDAGERGRNLREKMNLHNNEAGRWHVQSQMRQECKCHGMSGSCTVKTCWMRLPPFRVVGDSLKDRYDGASRVMVSNVGNNRNVNDAHAAEKAKNRKVNNNIAGGNSIHSRRENRIRKHRYGFQLRPYNPEHKPPGPKDLVYYEPSPPFCERNPKFGIQGTYGRQCNETSLGVDGCDLMCCGRGYTTQEVTVVERCNCMFHWCCEVKCNVCRTRKRIHTCL